MSIEEVTDIENFVYGKKTLFSEAKFNQNVLPLLNNYLEGGRLKSKVPRVMMRKLTDHSI